MPRFELCLVITGLLAIVGTAGSAQDFNYVHYDTREGLAGSTVYDMCQDNDGFMWFATDNGLSRFDGRRFINYTVKDGLADNEVLLVYPDSRGRVWIGTFSNQICYYYKGKIYNKKTDKKLGTIQIESPITGFAMDQGKNIYFTDNKSLFTINTNNDLSNLSLTTELSRKKNGRLSLLQFGTEKYPNIIIDDTVFWLTPKGLMFDMKISPKASNNEFPVRRNWYHVIKLEIQSSILSLTSTPNTSYYISTSNGSWSIDTINNKLGTHYMAGKRVSRTINDSENNIWFTTLGEGVYKLASTFTTTQDFTKYTGEKQKEVFCLNRFGNDLFIGAGYSMAILWQGGNRINTYNFKEQTAKSYNNYITNRIVCCLKVGSDKLIIGTDAFLMSIRNSTRTFSPLFAIKALQPIDSNRFIASTFSGAYIVDANTLQTLDTIWTGRCTNATLFENKYYITTLQGLQVVADNGVRKNLGDSNDTLGRRINTLAKTGSGLWIATSDHGLVLLKNGKPVQYINESHGLSSNICKTLFASRNDLWVGTNKGLNKIIFKGSDFTIEKFSIYDGLPSDIINAVYVEDSIVYVGSPAGLTVFNQTQLRNNSICNLELLNILNEDKIINERKELRFSYNRSRIAFDFTAISFKSAGDIQYFYKLDGLDLEWIKTPQNSIEYQSLTPGSYVFNLRATNKFGISSKTISIPFSITPPFWATWWFKSTMVILLLGGTGYGIYYRNKKIRQRLEEKTAVARKIAILEQQALQAQMNPHFIFNCLNSIQQFLAQRRIDNANYFLSSFANLVRETLDKSSRQYITLAEEMHYLQKYFDLEKLRYEGNLTYDIDIDNALDKDVVKIPTLLLQPYVENALRHGIRHKDDGGHVSVKFRLEDKSLLCIIEDNGVGRKNSKAIQSRQHLEYQSRGMNITKERMNIINAIFYKQITVRIIDLAEEAISEGDSEGTIVIINIPIEIYG